MDTAQDIILLLENSNTLPRLLEADLKSRTEVGCILREGGEPAEIRTGTFDTMTFALPPSSREVDDRRIIVHTHPSIDSGPTPSQSDLEIGEHPAVCGMVAISQEMFDVTWDGVAVYFDEQGNASEPVSFQITCNGTTDGPAEERWIENPRISR